MKRLLYIFLLFLHTCPYAWTQTKDKEFDRIISVEELFYEIVNAKKASVTFANIKIVHSDEKISKILRGEYMFNLFGDPVVEYSIVADKKVDLINCELPPSFRLVNSQLAQLKLLNTNFGNQLSIINSKVKGDFSIMSYKNSGSVTLDEFKTNGGVGLQGKFNNVVFKNSSFQYDSTKAASYKFHPSYRHHVNFEGECNSLQIINCKFSGSQNIEKMNCLTVSNTEIGDLLLAGDTLYSINMENLSIINALRVENTQIKNHVLPINVQLVPENTNFPWFQLKGNKLGISHESLIYKGLTIEECGEIYDFGDLLSVYNIFYKIYKNRGDKESMNNCYFEMKQLEGRRLEYIYTTNRTITSWFNFRLNQFLLVFCDYGTKPIKALFFSFWVIFYFAFLYFFNNSSWDKINKSFLITQHRRLIRYFLTKKSLKDFYVEEKKEEFLFYQDYKRDIKKSRELPFFISMLGPVLYWFALFNFRITRTLFNRVDILHTDWKSLDTSQKFFVGTKGAISVLIYIIYLITVKALNSIVLSINAFSTLGFGDIPVKGLSRYAAIIEGFIGWFLLSIFSVSLISQILQS